MTHKTLTTSTVKKLQAHAQALGQRAAEQHSEGIQMAVDALNQSLSDASKSERKGLGISIRPYPCNPRGAGVIVSILERVDDGPPMHHCEIVVATMPDKFQATSDGIATPVGYTTKALTIIAGDDSALDPMDWEPELAVVIWQKQTSEMVTETAGIEEFLGR